MARSDESCFLLHHVGGQVRVRRLPGEHMATGCTMGRRQASRGSVMLWAMFCWETKMVQEWFEEHNNEFGVLTWPPNSPGLNPIKHLWDVLDKQVRSMEAPPRKDLKILLQHLGAR